MPTLLLTLNLVPESLSFSVLHDFSLLLLTDKGMSPYFLFGVLLVGDFCSL